MAELTEDKTRRLLLIVEALAIGTAALLILIDYKIKQDLVALFRQIEAAMTYESRIYSANAGNPDSYSAVFGGAMVGDHPTMEAEPTLVTDKPDVADKRPASRDKAADGGAGTRGKKIPDTDKSVGS